MTSVSFYSYSECVQSHRCLQRVCVKRAGSFVAPFDLTL